ncbi:MAG: alpha,alpha-trehalase [Spirochaetales bacterium]|nr:MAG: alpha,alpha-trehalase [Spirochaetales bacterium]
MKQSRRVIQNYIRDHWDATVQTDGHDGGFAGIQLPYPYTTPCIKGDGTFSFFFYWDTYFTNLGLIRQGRHDLAESNIRNMMWLIDRYGFMPNHVGLDHRSQTPYFGLMVAEFLEARKSADDEVFARAAVEHVRQEYFFWFHARSTPAGLTRCGNSATGDYHEQFYDDALVGRLSLPPDASAGEKRAAGNHRVAECEAWDFTERFDGRALDFAVVEFNANLFAYETFLAGESSGAEAALWNERASLRRTRADRFLWNEARGLYLDYDVVNGAPGRVASATTFQPLFTGLASQEQAERVAGNLPLFEREFGLAATEMTPGCRAYQWAYPNMWPPLVRIVAKGLHRYGLTEPAMRIAGKYVEACDRLFERTGQLWEKIDVETGELAGGEYAAQPMIGWSAGVYVALQDILNGNQ